MPPDRQRWRSSERAPAVKAIIGYMTARSLLLADGSRRLVAIHPRHLAVHEDGVVLFLTKRFDGSLSIRDSVDPISRTG